MAKTTMYMRAYFCIQLYFAKELANKLNLPLSQSVWRFTNFFRRFGLGSPDIVSQKSFVPHPPLNGGDKTFLEICTTATASVAAWQQYANVLDGLQQHEEQLDWTQTFYRQSPPATRPANQRTFGCFSLELRNAGKVVRAHFGNHDQDHVSPLHPTKMAKRRAELRQLFAYVQMNCPNAIEVQGASWLYNAAAYRCLFPPTYGDSRQILTGMTKFQGSSSWGQFLTHRGSIRPALRNQFMDNLKRLDTTKLWEVFPVPTLTVVSPVQTFYEYYGV